MFIQNKIKIVIIMWDKSVFCCLVLACIAYVSSKVRRSFNLLFPTHPFVLLSGKFLLSKFFFTPNLTKLYNKILKESYTAIIIRDKSVFCWLVFAWLTEVSSKVSNRDWEQSAWLSATFQSFCTLYQGSWREKRLTNQASTLLLSSSSQHINLLA